MNKFFLLIILLLAGGKANSQTTYAEHVAPILFKNCTSCHRQGAIGPFKLETYKDAYNQRYSIAAATQSKSMPPWPPDAKYNRLAHERVLTTTEIGTIKTWVDGGALRGDSTLEPALPKFPSGSLLGSPDLTLKIPTYTVKSTKDDYRVFVVPTGLKADRYLTGLEFLPANKKIVHHILLYYDLTGAAATLDKNDPGPGYASSGGGVGVSSATLIGGWVPGASYISMPAGMGVNIPKGADLVIQIHYAPGSQNQSDSTGFNVRLASVGASLRDVSMAAALNHTSNIDRPLVIPPDTVVSFMEKFTLPTQAPFDVTILGLSPHMHLVGKSMKVYAVDLNKDTIPLIKINNWDFHWQGEYNFRNPIKIKRGTTLYAEATYDNTTNNPNNPNSPPKQVTLGESTTNEMMLVFFSYLNYQSGDENISLDTVALKTGIGKIPTCVREVSDLDIYPNPASDLVNLSFPMTASGQAAIYVYDMQGRMVYTSGNRQFQQGLQTMPLNTLTLPAGQYAVRLTTNDSVITKKLLINH